MYTKKKKGGRKHSLNRNNTNVYLKNSTKRCFDNNDNANSIEINSKKYKVHSIKRNNLIPRLKKCGYSKKPYGILKKGQIVSKEFNNNSLVNLNNTNNLFSVNRNNNPVNNRRNNPVNNRRNPVNNRPHNNPVNNRSRNNPVNNREKHNQSKDLIIADDFRNNVEDLNFPCWENSNCWMSHILICLLAEPHQDIVDALFNNKLDDRYQHNRKNGESNRSWNNRKSYRCHKETLEEIRIELFNLLNKLHKKHVDYPDHLVDDLYYVTGLRRVLRNCDKLPSDDFNRDSGFASTQEFIELLFNELFPFSKRNIYTYRTSFFNLDNNKTCLVKNEHKEYSVITFPIQESRETLNLVSLIDTITINNFIGDMSLENFGTGSVISKRKKRDEIEKIGNNYYLTKELKGKPQDIELYNAYKMSTGYSNEMCDDQFYEFQEVRSKILSNGGPLIIAANRQAYSRAPLTLTKVIPDEILTLEHVEGGDIQYKLVGIVVPDSPNEGGSSDHFNCYFCVQGIWWYFNDLGRCRNGKMKKGNQGLIQIGNFNKLMNSKKVSDKFRGIPKYLLGLTYVYVPL